MTKVEQAKKNFLNESGLDFFDVSSEEYREYHCVNSEILRIEEPIFLHISSIGGHRIYTASGRCYYVKPCGIGGGWWITWMPREGAPHFLK